MTESLNSQQEKKYLIFINLFEIVRSIQVAADKLNVILGNIWSESTDTENKVNIYSFLFID